MRLILLLVVASVLGACQGRAPEAGLEETIRVGSAGGTYAIAGLVITVPKDAFDRDATISVTTEQLDPAGYAVDGVVYRFAPEGLHFAAPATISFPTGEMGESVFWTVDGEEGRFEKRDTTVEGGRAAAQVTHFSRGFVGMARALADAGADAVDGVTCTVKRPLVVEAGVCTQSVTVEHDVRFWAEPYFGDLEGAMATDSSGIHAFANSGDIRAPLFIASDLTHTLYQLSPQPGSDNGTVHRFGSAITFTMDASRGRLIPPQGCDTVPLIEVHCFGATTLSSGPPVVVPEAGGMTPDGAVDGGTTDATTDPTNGVADVRSDVTLPDVLDGVTCTVKRPLVVEAGVCTQSVTVEHDVRFWAEPYFGDLEGAMATDSSGIHAFANSGDIRAPLFIASDLTHTLYQLSPQPGSDNGTVHRFGSAITFTMDASRGRLIPPQGCDTVPLIEVHCFGATTLSSGSP